jgi:hypothetical protein
LKYGVLIFAGAADADTLEQRWKAFAGTAAQQPAPKTTGEGPSSPQEAN